MPKSNIDISDQINHLYRHEYGKLVAVLTKTFGTANMELAEDVVQESLLEALNKWSYHGVPDNPVGWIYKVAKYKAINVLNREKYKREYVSELAHYLQSEWTAKPAINQLFSDKEIEDDQLRMIFTCCHPSISADSQVALTLKTLCGFSIPEIAKAFLTTQENINKRLVRARKTIRDANVPFEVPSGKELEKRLSSVLETIYLLFNEGYEALSGERLIQYELCEEAIRLTELIVMHPKLTYKSNAYALLALMLLNASRFKARIDKSGNVVDLEHQDRTDWDQDFIKTGLYYLECSLEQKEVSLYHILAAISAQHCTAKSYQTTDWKAILSLYDKLIVINDSPIVLLNRAIAIAKTQGPKKAIQALKNIKDKAVFQSYLPYYTTRAELHFLDDDSKTAIELLNKALKLPLSKRHKALINNKIQIYSSKN